MKKLIFVCLLLAAVSGLAVDRGQNMVWMSNWVNGRYVYGYDLASGKYVRKVHLRPVPQWQQGIFIADGRMLITADDGDADFEEPDNIYVADLCEGKSYAAALPWREMNDQELHELYIYEKVK